MKLLMFHCNRIQPKTRWEDKKLGRGLVVLVGEDKKDSEKEKYRALREIVKTLKYCNEKHVVLIPFPVIGEIENNSIPMMKKELIKTNYVADTLRLEDTTKLGIEIFGHRVSVAFRELMS